MGTELTLYQVDAFSSEVFSGNPAAVCPLQAWLSDTVLQSIAEVFNVNHFFPWTTIKIPVFPGERR